MVPGLPLELEVLEQLDAIDAQWAASTPASTDPRRMEFEAILKYVLGSPNVYYLPSDDSRMQYPCLAYELDNPQRMSADNVAYKLTPRYQVTFIRQKKDHPVVHKLLALPYSSHSRHYATSGLNHDVFSIYY